MKINERIPGTLIKLSGSTDPSIRARGWMNFVGENWRVVECHCSLCRSGEYVAINETGVTVFNDGGNGKFKWQHAALTNFELVSEVGI